MANASQPTKRTRHMDIRHFAIQEWVENDLIQLKRVDTTVNLSDTLTKPLQRILFYRHLDALMAIAPIMSVDLDSGARHGLYYAQVTYKQVSYSYAYVQGQVTKGSLLPYKLTPRMRETRTDRKSEQR
jgi:hypothetical protein